jgi:hemoglobin/transferrin/lactoferrin receptor protein
MSIAQKPIFARHCRLAVSIAAAIGVSAHAADEIEELVIVGSTTNTVITPAELQKYDANDLSDVFRQVPSVSVGGSLGIAQKVYLRGLEDTLLNITVDGAPQTGTLFHHIGRVAVEPELLQQVSVQAGAGEATSGAGAIGGAIRFKTKNVDDLLGKGRQFGGLVKGGYFSNDGYRGSTSVYGRLNDNWGALASYSYVDRNNMEDGDGNELYGTAAEQSLAFVKLSGELTDNQQLSISYEARNEEGEFGARPNWPTLEGDTLFPMDGQRETLVINHRL